MDKILKLVVCILFFTATPALAIDPVAVGFSVNGKPINPKCINLMQAWMSDTETSIREIVLDECQTSNLAFEGIENQGQTGDTVYYYEDPKDAHSYFGYDVIGVTESGLYVLKHGYEIGIYRIRSGQLYSDILKGETQTRRIITFLGSSSLKCRNSATVVGNSLVVTARKYDFSSYRDNQCTDEVVTITFDLSDIKNE
ncbi:hypothetical protein [Magnetovibrio blakemorei]|uniref:Uncharacterized protein n=1 Tax=Magnetovibrio blakemorei TaxID=28181 RepID=A0A1E5Q5S6_9PROT|nr:hypothetical protein [Magnetovibrio blakemorei]OEJ65648.1 hypothetical protein BEN30_13905 [Magnetovibrio blakemorei]